MTPFTRLRSSKPLMVVLGFYILAWLVIFTAIPPGAQNIPLNDDWAYSQGLRSILNGHGINYYNWASMPLLGQWLWAMPFAVLLGQSDAVLRLSTIVLSLSGISAYYGLLRTGFNLSAALAAFAAGTLAFTPLIFTSSGTFMTDMPALSLSLTSLYFYYRGLKEKHSRMLWIGMLFALAAGITRQNTLAVPLSILLMITLDPGYRRNVEGWVTGIIPVIVTLLTYYWFLQRPDKVGANFAPTLVKSVQISIMVLYWCGIAVIPLLCLGVKRLSGKVFVYFLFLIAFYGVSFWLQLHRIPPFMGSVIGLYGPNLDQIGPLEYTNPTFLSADILWLFSIGGAIGAALAATAMISFIPLLWRHPLVLYSMLNLGALFILKNTFDRYAIVFFPLFIAVAALSVLDKPAWKMGIVVLGMMALFSLSYMHDWLARNKAIWDSAERAASSGVPAAEIEAGFEWDEHLFSKDRRYWAPCTIHNIRLRDIVRPSSGEHDYYFSWLKQRYEGAVLTTQWNMNIR